MNRLKLIRTSLEDETLIKKCKVGRGYKTCPFLYLQTSVNQKGVLGCCNFTREAVEMTKKIREKTGELGTIGCPHVLEKFIETQITLIGKLVEYIDKPNIEEKLFSEFLFKSDERNFSIFVKTERDKLPFVALSANPERVCIKETKTHIIITNIIGHNHVGISICK